MIQDDCQWCHGAGYYRVTGKLCACDECAGTGRAEGAYKQIPKESGFGFKQAIEFAVAVVLLVPAIIAYGVAKVFGR